MRVSAVMPCRGRVQQTLELIPRLKETAGMGFELICVIDGDAELVKALLAVADKTHRLHLPERVGYWRAFQAGVRPAWGTLIVNLANDLLPGRDWLKRAVDAYVERFGDADGMIGFNDGIHTGGHAAHFVIARALLERWYGDDYAPQMYGHSFGDTEMCQRAIQEKIFAVAPFAVLYHNHPYSGGETDAVYAEGQATLKRDFETFQKRQAQRWMP